MPLLVVIPVAFAVAASAVGARADSFPDVVLTDQRVAEYVALDTALKAHWQATGTDGMALLAAAPVVSLTVGQQWSLIARVSDYPALVKRDQALAAIFIKHQLAPAQFEILQVGPYTRR